jgi:hypothetical protein
VITILNLQIGIGRSGKAGFALTGLETIGLRKPNTKVVDVNIIGVIYTARLAQYYLLNTKSNDPKAIVFIGSIGKYNYINVLQLDLQLSLLGSLTRK